MVRRRVVNDSLTIDLPLTAREWHLLGQGERVHEEHDLADLQANIGPCLQSGSRTVVVGFENLWRQGCTGQQHLARAGRRVEAAAELRHCSLCSGLVRHQQCGLHSVRIRVLHALARGRAHLRYARTQHLLVHRQSRQVETVADQAGALVHRLRDSSTFLDSAKWIQY